ncbi:MAG: H-NS family nucleoid-associated regulatory protein [Gammaproteobacteria bacterium]
MAPKFRNPDTGATWTGRGRTPRWILDAEQSGGSRDSFKI